MVDGAPEHKNFGTPVTPKPAASLVLLRGPKDNPEVLLGKRRHDLRFMPGFAVFPGGRVDPIDSAVAESHALPCEELPSIDAPLSGKDWIAHSLAACRECVEETGLLPIGADIFEGLLLHSKLKDVSHSYLEACRMAEERIACFPLPCIAQAITPENSPIRFNARFFYADGEALIDFKEPDGELNSIGWYNLKDAFHQLTLADVTEFVLRESLKFYQTGHIPEIPPLLTYDFRTHEVIIQRNRA